MELSEFLERIEDPSDKRLIDYGISGHQDHIYISGYKRRFLKYIEESDKYRLWGDWIKWNQIKEALGERVSHNLSKYEHIPTSTPFGVKQRSYESTKKVISWYLRGLKTKEKEKVVDTLGDLGNYRTNIFIMSGGSLGQEKTSEVIREIGENFILRNNIPCFIPGGIHNRDEMDPQKTIIYNP